MNSKASDGIFLLISVVLFCFCWHSFGLVIGASWGFVFALLSIVSVKELTRSLVAAHLGIKLEIPWIWPIGSVPNYKSRTETVQDESILALSTLASGIAASYLCLLAGTFAGLLEVTYAGYAGAALSLFCLIPLPPLDGGIVNLSVGRWTRYVGLILLIMLTFQGGIFGTSTFFIGAVILSIASIMDVHSRREHLGESPEYYEVSGKQRVIFGALYLALIATVLVF